MEEKNILDNLTGQEIKELIVRNEITMEQLNTSALYSLLDYETDKLSSGEGDMSIINKCSELLDKNNEVVIFTESEISEIVARVQDENISIVKRNACQTKRFSLKRALIVAAAIVMLMACSAMVASAFGYNIFEKLGGIVFEPIETAFDATHKTIKCTKDVTKYASIEEMLEDRNYDIMYPTKFPGDVEVTEVTVCIYYDETQVHIATSDPNIYVRIDFPNRMMESSNPDTYTHNGITHVIMERKDTGNMQSACTVDNVAYYIIAPTRDELICIIDNLKE